MEYLEPAVRATVEYDLRQPHGTHCLASHDAYSALLVAYDSLLAKVRGDRSGLCSDPECWRTADVGQTCHHHSGYGDLPSARLVTREE